MEYHKIQTLFKRDMEHGTKIILGNWTLPEFDYLQNNQWIFTEKVDGTNIRVMWNGESVIFGGKTDEAQMPIFLLYKLQELFEGITKRQMFKNKFGTEGKVYLYGEGFGAKIQKGGGNYIKDGVSFVLFDVKIDDLWLKREDVEDIAKHFEISIAPIIGEGTLNDAIKMTKKGFNSKWGDFIAEGVVARPKIELKTRRGERIITKIKYKDFKGL